MTYNEAMSCLGQVVGTTNGWSNDSINVYAKRMTGWHDLPAAREACKEIADTWTRASQPPFGVLQETYQSVMRRNASGNVRPIMTANVVSVREGREIAAKAYAQECKRLGKEPNEQLFARIISKIGA